MLKTSRKLDLKERYELRLLAADHIALLMKTQQVELAQSSIELVGDATTVYSAITYLEIAWRDIDELSSDDDLYAKAHAMLDLYHELRSKELNRN